MIECLAFHDHHQWKSHEICARKRKNKSGKRKKNEEQLREKSLILKLAPMEEKALGINIKKSEFEDKLTNGKTVHY